jgi:hypothetical protein
LICPTTGLSQPVSVSSSLLELGANNVTLPALSLGNSGTLDRSGTLTITGALALSSAYMSGTGWTVAQGLVSITGGLVGLSLTGGRTFENQGTATVSGTSDYYGYGDVAFAFNTGGTNSFSNDAGAMLWGPRH